MVPTPPLTTVNGPAIRAVDSWLPGEGHMRQVLSNGERTRLARIGSIVRFRKGDEIYRAGDPADAIYNVTSGVVKAYRTTADGSERISAFLFPDDLFGLSAEGRYASSARAITRVSAYRFSIPVLQTRLAKDADLEFHVIGKLCHELRQAQRHAFLLSERPALSKLAMFLQMLDQMQAARGETTDEIYLPMSRSDIADYVALSLAAVSRGFHTLIKRGIIHDRDRSHVEIVDRRALSALAADPTGPFPSVSTAQ
jgi:CRP-like cAMP-binding protein